MKSYLVLDKINGPEDLKNLTPEEMAQLCSDIREKIVDAISGIGGHFASSLGVVELTVALHYLFNSPQDKIVWDTGHQSYPHKLLTGRRNELHTVKQYGGISGFPRRYESPHDIFATGHASTSLSAAFGLAKARDARGGNEHIIAVIGDGALSGGIAYEALNNIGHYKTKNLIVILNDNAFSIARSVGAVTQYLGKLRNLPFMRKTEIELRDFMKRLPLVGNSFGKATETLDQGLTFLTAPDKMGILFEEFGFRYIGPIDGHNLPDLISHLNLAKKIDAPVLLHVVTTKGKGYEFAEEDATTFHGVTPFDVSTGKMKKSPSGAPPAYTTVFGNTLVELAKKDERVAAITAAMPDGTGLVKFSKEIPDRYYDVGIAEEHAVIFAAGLAVGGMKPVVALYSTFMQRAFDPVIHDVCLQNLPVIFCLDRAGMVGEDGGAFHGIFDLTYLSCIPNMSVMAPKDENELRQMLFTALNWEKGPVTIRYPRGSGVGVPLDLDFKTLPWGKGEVVKTGKKLVFIAIGRMVNQCVKAAELLSKEGIDAGIINARFAKPLDEELLLKAAADYPYVMTVEENVLQGGFGSAVLQLYNRHSQLQNVSFEALGVPDRFVEHGSPSILLKECGLDPEGIAARAKSFILGKKQAFPMAVSL
ncbi:MAG: 1-deoxy-D-xylulose-5-phosphate synthase [Candidatus Eremiobacteraeota bacterium]|nr:1-deoxy-D-xylulose-5-phosphate synthase [Candidatus Eremiobacteraeota bacterium]